MTILWALLLCISQAYSASWYYDYPTLHHNGQPVEFAYGLNALENKFNFKDRQLQGLQKFSDYKLDPSLIPSTESAIDNYLGSDLMWQMRMPNLNGQNPYQFHMIDCQVPCDTDDSSPDTWSDLLSNHTAWPRIGLVMRDAYSQFIQNAQSKGIALNDTQSNFKFAMNVYSSGAQADDNLLQNQDSCTTVLLESLAGLMDWDTFISFFNYPQSGDGDKFVTAGDYCRCPTAGYSALRNLFRGAKMVVFHGDTAAWRLSLLASGPSCV